jgi:hypothetical protein
MFLEIEGCLDEGENDFQGSNRFCPRGSGTSLTGVRIRSMMMVLSTGQALIDGFAPLQPV